MQNNKRTLMLAYIAGIGLLLLDGVTKWIANRYLPFQDSVLTGLPFLSLYRTYNTGYHFLFGNIANQQVWAISGIILVVFLVISLSRSLLKETDSGFNNMVTTIIIALMVGSAGNVIEVLATHKATDFFVFHPFPWPSNICDQYINAIIYVMLPITIIKAVIDWSKKRKRAINDPAQL